MRLPASLRYSLYATTGVLVASGLTRGSALPRVHGAAAMLELLLVGIVIALHAAAAWRERKNRFLGALLGGILAVLALTGYLLYYSGSDETRAASSLVHWLVGLALPAALGVHVWLGRRAAQRASAPA